MKKSLAKIEKKLKILKPALRKQFNVRTIGVFGSYQRREERASSDLDILVDFSKTGGLFEFIELENFLSDRLDSKVDLVMKDALKPRLKEGILREVVYI